MELDATAQLVRDLMLLHARSLANFLADAHPWEADQQQRSRHVVAEIAQDQRAVADRLGRWLVEHCREAGQPPFAPRFASLHDLSAEFLLPELQRQQESLVAALDNALPRLRGSGLLEATAQEALGIAKAHRDLLADLAAVPRPAPD
ncbi:MAG: hypothetical protein MUF48_19320 [Pirellulaceae bacterium]|jgi:hypothetical protein|nr:hypothetical protein [Pirellulaceae bacterium]